MKSSLRVVALVALMVAGSAQAATLAFTGTAGVGSPLGVNAPAKITYTVLSKNASHDNVFLYDGTTAHQLRVGQSHTISFVPAGLLNFGFMTAGPSSANFFGTPVLNGSSQIRWSLASSTLARIGFEDIRLPGGDKDYNDLIVSASISAVPLPGAALLFGTSIMGFLAARRRRQAAPSAA